MDLNEFNRLEAEALHSTLRSCLDVERWIDAVSVARPYTDREAAVAAGSLVSPLRADEIATAMAHHPRIGEKARGDSAAAAHSTREQAGLGELDDSVTMRLTAGNRAYEEKFDRVFLIRAAGRGPEEILAELERRMDNDDETELAEVGEQLLQIAALRLEGLLV